jgi:hypothetical protein
MACGSRDLCWGAISRSFHVGSPVRHLQKALPLRTERKGIFMSGSAADFALLLVVDRSAFELFACRIGYARLDRASFTIGRHNNSASRNNLAIFLAG